MFSRDDMYTCANYAGMDWILTMGDSQEREFVAQMKMMNGSVLETTKFEQADFIMHESMNKLRVTWQFYTESYMWRDTFLRPREFKIDQKFFDHFNIRPTLVCACVVSFVRLYQYLGADSNKHLIAECVPVCVLKGLVLLRVSPSGQIALAGSTRLCSMLPAAPVLFAHIVVTVSNYKISVPPRLPVACFGFTHAHVQTYVTQSRAPCC